MTDLACRNPPGRPAIPRHLAVIMDGNGRWARARGLPRVAGHRQGLARARELVAACGERGIPYLTLFAFSSENWQRPPEEVHTLLDLFMQALDHEVEKLHRHNVRLRIIGDVARFGERLVERIRAAEALTAGNTGLVLHIAANYGGRWDITQACARLAERCRRGELAPEEITPAQLAPLLSLGEAPDPDLFIRSGGESRLSNFLLWHLAYTELYFTPVLWPDFDRAQLEEALAWYAGRQRRFGRTGEQVEAAAKRHA